MNQIKAPLLGGTNCFEDIRMHVKKDLKYNLSSEKIAQAKNRCNSRTPLNSIQVGILVGQVIDEVFRVEPLSELRL